jgi:clan AA aspartic protease
VIGRIDESGRAILDLVVLRGHLDSTGLTVWVDTAFDGELVVSRQRIEELGLLQTAAVEATLANGTKVILETFECSIEWFGTPRTVEVIANEGRLPLLGIGLLDKQRLIVDYRQRTLELD